MHTPATTLLRPRFVAVLAAALLQACAPASAPITPAPPAGPRASLSTDLPSYGPGAEVRLRLANPGPGAIGYNLCRSRLEQFTQQRWTELRPLAEVCTAELRSLQPRQEAAYVFRLDAATPAGQYRVSTRIEDMAAGRGTEITSNTFAVTPRAPR
jgi:hypothetical protein